MILPCSRFFGVALMLVASLSTKGQSKVYVSAGLSNVFGPGINILIGQEGSFFKFNHPALDVEYQTRVIGAFNFATGLSFFSAGYSTKEESFGSPSEFNATYVAIPLMARWNAGNKNYLYFDFGAVPFYLVTAHLRESFDKYGNNDPIVVEGDISKYSNRFYYAFKFQMLVLMNRFYAGIFIIAPSKGQSTLNGLEGHWGLNNQQSTYLLSNGFSGFSMIGLKVGVRVK